MIEEDFESGQADVDDHFLLRGVLYLLCGIAALQFLHLTAGYNNPTSSPLVSLFWLLAVAIPVSMTWYARVGKRHVNNQGKIAAGTR